MKLKYQILILVFLISSKLQAQVASKTLSQQQLTELVKKFHPIAKQADINIEKAKADITITKGLFDPYASAKIANKTFDGTAYYSYVKPELIIPTWYGIELNAGIENLSGSRTDPQETQGRTSFAGITIPLAKNLVIDKRRAALQQSKIFKQLSEMEKKAVLNDLLLDALHAYWNWVKHYQVLQVVKNAVQVNEKRFELVKTAYRQGDRPAIDTTEALTQLQSFRYMMNEAELMFITAGLELSLFLWKENEEPYVLPSTVVPDEKWREANITDLPLPVADELLALVRSNHPDIVQYDFKLDALKVERRLKFQELLPAVNFRYNQLGKGYDILKTTTGPLFENNYQYGITVGIPLRLSEGRGEYKKAKLKIKETQLGRNLKTLEVENKVLAYYNELLMTRKQVAIQKQQHQSFLALQKGEETRFFNGESSLFLINSRENKTLEAMQKLVELETKYFKTLSSLQWAAGILFNQ